MLALLPPAGAVPPVMASHFWAEAELAHEAVRSEGGPKKSVAETAAALQKIMTGGAHAAPARKRPSAAAVNEEGEMNVRKRPAAATAVPVFPGIEQQPPIYWGPSTIYTSSKTRCWRIKLNQGDRLDHAKPFTANPEEGWQDVIKYIRSVRAEL